MHIEFRFEGGTPCDIEKRGDADFHLLPIAAQSGSQWFYCCVRLEDLPKGATARIDITWPAKWSVDDMPAGVDEETVNRQLHHDNFATAIHRCIYISPDMKSWSRVEIEPAEDRTISIPVTGTGQPIYLATQLPYTREHLAELLEHVRATAADTLTLLGQSRAGCDMWLVDLPATGREDAPIVYVQALQHISEFSGPLVADAMVRYLLSPERAAARKHLHFQILPVFDIDGMQQLLPRYMSSKNEGSGNPRDKNPNRDWVERDWPETRNVVAHIERMLQACKRFAVGLDLHNGWWKHTHSAACYTRLIEGEASEDYRARQTTFIDHMYAKTNHERPGHYWEHATGGRTFAAVFPTLTDGTIAHTVEFSRHMWWSHEAGDYLPAEPGRPAMFAREAVNALAEYFG